MPSPSTANKFRPYFTHAQLSEIIRCCKLASSDLALLTYLESFSLKINHGIIDPAISLKPTLESRLGLATNTGPEPYSPAELYNIWKANPEYIRPADLIKVQQYRWENELMTPEEARHYEDSLVSGS